MIDYPKLLQAAQQREEEYLTLLEQLVRHESPSGRKDAADTLASFLETTLTERGWTVTRHPRKDVGDIIEATLDGGIGPRSLLLTHYDTVWPIGTLNQMPFRRDGNDVYGPGVLDMKSGITAAILAPELLAEANGHLRGHVTLLLTSDEEIGSNASRELIEERARKHDRVLVMEMAREDGALKVGRKGVGDIDARFRGISAHAGNNPAAGASALRELAHFLLFVEDLSDDVAGTTVNLTVAEGGFARNVIAEDARAEVDLRVLKRSEENRIMSALKAYTPRDSRVEVELSGGLNRPPMELNDANNTLFEEAQDILTEFGLAYEGAVVGGGSDGNFTSAIGVATLDGLGSVGIGPHARNEHIDLARSLERLALVAALIGE